MTVNSIQTWNLEYENILFRTKISFKIDYYILMYNDVSLDLQLLQFTSKITKKENVCKITEQVYRATVSI